MTQNETKNNWKEGKIDLSGNGGMMFQVAAGTCGHCRGYWPLLSNVGLCQACILIHLPGDIRTKDIIVPDEYMNETPDDYCCENCGKDTKNDKLFIHMCHGKFCLKCVKDMEVNNDGTRTCPKCSSNFTIAPEAVA